MPEFVNPDETESRQSLYRDLLSHLNETIWGSPSTLPRSESRKWTLDFNPVEAFDKSKNPEGLIYAEPDIKWTESQIRGYPKAIAQTIRRAMQNEFKLRGKKDYSNVIKRQIPDEPYRSTEDLLYKSGYDFDWTAEQLKNSNLPKDQLKKQLSFLDSELKRLPSSDPEELVASKLLRGTWYRGQEEYPQILGKEKLIDPSTGKEGE